MLSKGDKMNQLCLMYFHPEALKVLVFGARFTVYILAMKLLGSTSVYFSSAMQRCMKNMFAHFVPFLLQGAIFSIEHLPTRPSTPAENCPYR